MEQGIPVWQEPVRGFYADTRLFARSGLDAARALFDDYQLPPPIHYLFGLTFEDAGDGTALFTMPATRWLLSPQGLISGATLALLVDGPLGCAVQTKLPPATPFTTAELSLSFLRPVNDRSGVLRAVGRSVHAGRAVALANAEVMDAAGRRALLASTRCAVLPEIDLAGDAASEPLPKLTEPEWDTPHPFLRPAPGEVQPQSVFDTASGLDVLRGCVTGEIPAPPLAHLTGVRPVSVEEGASEWVMPATEWLCSPVAGRLYGGATAMLAGLAVEGSIETTVPAGTSVATVDLKVYFLRPVTPDGHELEARGNVVHRGRTAAIAVSQVVDSTGRQVAMATGSALILPGRAAALADPAAVAD